MPGQLRFCYLVGPDRRRQRIPSAILFQPSVSNGVSQQWSVVGQEKPDR